MTANRVPASTLGRVLVVYRTNRALGVRAMARVIGVSSATLSRVERGHSMSLTTWLKVQEWLMR